MTKFIKVRKDGSIIIPKAFRQALGIKSNDLLELTIEGNIIIIKKVSK